jgi:diguanylate cyclase (GGDEF)-like protein
VGGEEFLVGCVGADASLALELAERLRSGIEELRVAAPDGSALRFTASFGVSRPFRSFGKWPAAAKNADRALYAAKASGRNRVIAA